MSKFWIIFRREYAQVVRKKSFIVGILLTPVILGALTIGPTFLARMQSSETEKLAVIDRSEMQIGQSFKEALTEYTLPDSDMPYYSVEQVFELPATDSVKFAEIEDSLRHEIQDKDLKYFLVINQNPQVSDTNLYLVTNSDSFRSLNRFEKQLSNVLSSIRLEMSDINLSTDSVLALTGRIDLVTRDAKGESLPFQVKYFSMLAFLMIMFGMIIGYGQIVMRSVIEEKNSRIMEVLISSVSPFQLLAGKIAGLGAATFTQIGVWVIIGTGLYFMRGSLSIPSGVDRIIFDPFIIISFVLFLIAGYLFYSTIFALIGSIVNSEKEAQNFIMPVTMVFVLPFMVGIYVIQQPNSTASIVMSFIPLLTPSMMMMRVIFLAPSLTEYTLNGIVGEALLGFVTLSLSVVAIIWLTAKIFRIGILMYGKRPTFPEIMKWIKY
ncbi:MAG: ABC transporter permease [candidate division Zixibacteria bacterium]|nr:ABC transporter permease [candidate division Zixibacteria bacterium]